MRHRQTGASLIEVLIAAFIFSAGILAVLAIQTKAFQLSNESYFRTQAAFLADGIIATLGGQTDTVFAVQATTMVASPRIKPAYTAIDWSAAPTSTPNCDNASTNCSWAQTTNYNANMIKRQVADTLPNGQIRMYDCRTASYGFCLAIAWQEKDVDECDGSETTTSGNVELEDKCYVQYIGL